MRDAGLKPKPLGSGEVPGLRDTPEGDNFDKLRVNGGGLWVCQVFFCLGSGLGFIYTESGHTRSL